MRNTFVIITSNFYMESFLRNECKYYKADDKVLVFNIADYDKNDKKATCEEIGNITIYNGCFHKVSKLKMFRSSLTNRHYWLEMFNLIYKKRGFNIARACEAASVIAHGKEFAKKIKDLLEKESVNANETVFYSYWLSVQTATILELKKWFPQGVFISRCHGMDVYEMRTKNGYEPFREYFIKNIDGLYAISEDGKRHIEKYIGRQAVNIHVEHLGSINHLSSISACKKEENKLRIVTCSRIDRNKRLDRMISILALIRDIDLEWEHYGKGSAEIETELKQMCNTMLGQNVKVSFKGHIANEDIIIQYQKECYDVFMNVSESEGIPVSIMEALSVGIPAVAFDVGGMREIVKDGISGFLLHENCDLNEAVKILRLMAEMGQQECIEMRSRAREFWYTNFNADNNYSKYINEIRSL